MKIFVLTHAEAADPAVINHVSKLMGEAGQTIALGDASVSATFTGPDAANRVAGMIGYGPDHPSEGRQPVNEVFGGQQLAAQAFGAQAGGFPLTPIEALQQGVATHPQPGAGALSTAGADQWATAPVVGHMPSHPGAEQTTGQLQHAQLLASAVPAPSAHANLANPALNAGVAVDSEGYPWDARIHSSSKTQTKKGVWVAKRNLNDQGFVNQVKAELKQLMSVPSPAGGPSGAPAAFPGPSGFPPPLVHAGNVLPAQPNGVTNPPAFGAVPPGSQVATSPQLPSAPVSGAMPASPSDFPSFVLRISPYVDSGQISQQTILAAAQACQLPGFSALAQRPDLIPNFINALKQYGINI